MPTASRAHHVQMLVRLQPSMKRWLEDQASEAGTSVNDEVIRIVRAAMRQEARQRQKQRQMRAGQ
jgi:predicted HicB family RNase H-like nuclease